uniref:Uncharacterized protein n=1 Tax=Aegilops tauschii subsp. strangulata TaxID=200361 RepID=A0A453R0L2_AEGTS
MPPRPLQPTRKYKHLVKVPWLCNWPYPSSLFPRKSFRIQHIANTRSSALLNPRLLTRDQPENGVQRLLPPSPFFLHGHHRPEIRRKEAGSSLELQNLCSPWM